MDGGAWKTAIHGVAEGRTRLSDFTFTFHFHALEKEMATHSSVLAWRIPDTGEPGGLLSMGSHRVGHDWSDLAAATIFTFGPQFLMLFHWSGFCVFFWIWWPLCFQWSMVKMTLGDFSRLLKTISILPPAFENPSWGPVTWYVSSPTAQRLPCWEKAPANVSGPHTKVLGSQERQIFNQSWVASSPRIHILTLVTISQLQVRCRVQTSQLKFS